MSRKIMLVVAVIVLVSATAAFAGSSRGIMGKGMGQPGFRGQAEPVENLEAMQEKISQMLTDGKLTQEQADARLAELETRIAEAKAWAALTLDEKIAKLLAEYEARLEAQVEAGRVSQETADEWLATAKEKIADWDGHGMPNLRPGAMGKMPGRGCGNRTPGAHCQEALDEAVKDGVINQDQADALHKYFTL